MSASWSLFWLCRFSSSRTFAIKRRSLQRFRCGLTQLSERSQQGSSASIGSNRGVNGSPFLDGQTITIAGAALQQRVQEAVAKADGALMSSQLELEGPDAKNGFVSLTASMEVSQAGCADDPLRHRSGNAIPIR